MKSRNDFDKLLSRDEINTREKIWNKHPFLIKEAGTKTMKVTSLNHMFQFHFGEGESIRGSFKCEGHEWRLLYYNKWKVEAYHGNLKSQSKPDNQLYVEIITEDAIMHRINMDCYETLGNWLFRYWNPGGVYAVEGWLLERS